jgi:transposase-like protein
VWTLRTWVDNNKKLGTSHVGSGNKKIEVSDPDKARLIKENKELQRANEILKEALTFFVVSQKK